MANRQLVMQCSIDISIVSHGHGGMVRSLVSELHKLPEVGRIILTRNVPDDDGMIEERNTVFIQNSSLKGFGANHNAAFVHSDATWFCVLNPDIELSIDPFPDLLGALNNSGASLVAPSVINRAGVLEDSVRLFPTIKLLASKLFGQHDGRIVLEPNQGVTPVDWVAGMFMLFRAEDFRAIGGFDEKFFLYYEDVDICARLWRSGRSVMVCPQVQVVHNAQRASRRNFQYMKWHAASMVRYFRRHWGRLPKGGST